MYSVLDIKCHSLFLKSPVGRHLSLFVALCDIYFLSVSRKEDRILLLLCVLSKGSKGLKKGFPLLLLSKGLLFDSKRLSVRE